MQMRAAGSKQACWKCPGVLVRSAASTHFDASCWHPYAHECNSPILWHEEFVQIWDCAARCYKGTHSTADWHAFNAFVPATAAVMISMCKGMLSLAHPGEPRVMCKCGGHDVVCAHLLALLACATPGLAKRGGRRSRSSASI